MDIQVEKHGDIVIIKFVGRLDSFTSPKVEAQLKALIIQNKKIVLNFSDLDYISSAGIRLILSVSKQLELDNGKLVLCCVNENVLEVIRLTGFDQILKIYNSEIESISHF